MKILIIPAALALAACQPVADYTGVSPEQQLCLAIEALSAEGGAIPDRIAAAGITCLMPDVLGPGDLPPARP